MVQENSENRANQIFYRLELHIFGQRDLMHFMQNVTTAGGIAGMLYGSETSGGLGEMIQGDFSDTCT